VTLGWQGSDEEVRRALVRPCGPGRPVCPQSGFPDHHEGGRNILADSVSLGASGIQLLRDSHGVLQFLSALFEPTGLWCDRTQAHVYSLVALGLAVGSVLGRVGTRPLFQ
jgi:hypothetical protein